RGARRTAVPRRRAARRLRDRSRGSATAYRSPGMAGRAAGWGSAGRPLTRREHPESTETRDRSGCLGTPRACAGAAVQGGGLHKVPARAAHPAGASEPLRARPAGARPRRTEAARARADRWIQGESRHLRSLSTAPLVVATGTLIFPDMIPARAVWIWLHR